MSRLALALLVLAAAGCAPMHWVRPDTPPGEFARDLAQCREEALQTASWQAWSWPPYGPGAGVAYDALGRPRFTAPYSPFGEPMGDRFFTESRLADTCMRVKGYELVPANEPPPTA